MSERSVLDRLSMVTANFEEGLVFADVVNDWFNFLAGKPGEVVVVDCGSSAETQANYWKLFQEGIINKLQLIHADSDDFGKDKGYIKEYTAGAIATKPYVLFFKTDTLPFRKGHENWLEEAIGYLDRDDVFAVSGSWNLPSKHHDAWSGWYFSQKCSYNFALMKRSTFMAALHEFGDEFIQSGFKSENPAINQERYFIEVAFEKYIQRHNVFTLCKIEDPNWTVFHTNTHEERLQQVREQYFAREDVERFMNLGFSDAEPDPSKALYYGLPPENSGLMKQLQIAIGKSPIGPYWRSLKQVLLKSQQTIAS